MSVFIPPGLLLFCLGWAVLTLLETCERYFAPNKNKRQWYVGTAPKCLGNLYIDVLSQFWNARDWQTWIYRVLGVTWILRQVGLLWLFSTFCRYIAGSTIGQKVAAWYRNWNAESSPVFDIEAPRIHGITYAADWVHVQPGCIPHAAHLQPICAQSPTHYATLPMHTPYGDYV